MKIIDLLVKISKGEEVPKKIKYNDDSYIHVDNYCYFCEETNEILSQNIYAEFSRLNDEVEVIEEEKEIEKLSFCDFAITINENASNNDRILMDKINEIIDVINDMRDKE